MARSGPDRAPWLALVLILMAWGCDAAPRPNGAGGFTEITAEVGLDFRHRTGMDGRFRLPEIIGSGGALFDHDGDGDLDIYLVDSAGPDRLYSREPDGTYRDRTAESGLGHPGYGMGATLGDVDNDGDLDLYVTNDGPDALYRNEGDGTFRDVTASAGLGHPAWSTSAAFCDYDGDGHLDLLVVTYVRNDPALDCTDSGGRQEYCNPSSYRGVPDVLYRNEGDGTFTDVSEASGIGRTATRGLGLACGDFDDDGRTDFFVANDGEANELWRNDGEGRFVERGVVAGAAVNLFGDPEAGMGVAYGDADGDLDLDLFVTHLTRETNTLYTNLGGGTFQDVTSIAGLGPDSLPYTGFGTGFLDADRDGDLDVVVVNGRVTRGDDAAPAPAAGTAVGSFLASYAEPNGFWLNDGSGRFDGGCDAAGRLCTEVEVSRGLLAGDVDGDGDLDLLVTNSNGPARLYRNDLPDTGHWIVARALDPALGRDAVGARVHLRTAGMEIVRPVTHAYGYLVGGEASVHFGLGASPEVDAFLVRWPDGTRERFAGTPADRVVRLERGAGRVITGSTSW